MPALTGKAFPLNAGFVGIVDNDQVLDVDTTSGNILVSDGTVFQSTAPGSSGLATLSFTTIAVSGQSDVVADSSTDTLTLVAGSNVTITTNAGTDTITIAASASGNSFTTIDCSSGTDPVADSSSDTLTLTGGNGISVTGSSAADSVTYALTTLTTDWLATTNATKIEFRSTLQSIYSSAAQTLDLDAENRINFRVNGTIMAGIDAGAINIEDSNSLNWGGGTVYFIGDSFSNTLDIAAATLNIFSTTVDFDGADLTDITDINFAGQLISTIATGTAPFTVNSTTKVDNLNVDLLDGLDSAAFAQNAFKTISTTSGTAPVADSPTDTLTITAGTGMTVTGDSSTDTITIATTITQYTDGLAQAAAGWQDDGTVVRLVGTTDEIVIGGTAALSSAKVSIDGDADQIQLIIQGEASQSADLLVLETSAGTDLWNVSASGHTTWATTGEARFRASTNRLYSRAANVLTLEGNTTTEVGKTGFDTRIGGGTLTVFYAQTDQMVDLGKSTNKFNECFFGQTNITDAKNIILGTGTGTKIGTSTSQKLAFFNSTPIVQPGATTDLGTVLSNLGLRAAGTAYPITTSGAVVFTGGVTISTVGLTVTDVNLILSTSTGTKIGTGVTQKIGFWNATPVVQSTGWTTSNVTTDKVIDANSTSIDELADVVCTLIEQLKTYGLLGA